MRTRVALAVGVAMTLVVVAAPTAWAGPQGSGPPSAGTNADPDHIGANAGSPGGPGGAGGGAGRPGAVPVGASTPGCGPTGCPDNCTYTPLPPQPGDAPG